VVAALALGLGCGADDTSPPLAGADLATRGKESFRFDPFGDEATWTDVLRLDAVLPTLAPVKALHLGLKLDVDALPADVAARAPSGAFDLGDPATMLVLLRMNAVVGLVGTVERDKLTRVGVTCALCHSTVDDSSSKGIGHRLDGYRNPDLDLGALLALSPRVSDAKRLAYRSWDRGKVDLRLDEDGDHGAVVIRPVYGLRGLHTFTSTGDALGHGSVGETPALREYVLGLAPPAPPAGLVDAAAAARGQTVFAGLCAGCHEGPLLTDANERLHDPSEVVSEPEPHGAPSYASRSATKRYRTPPLHGVWQHAPYFHNGTAANLEAVVDTYDERKQLGLTAAQRADLVQYLKSL
jgi:hypothetical protein